uniref:Uncharacterized protein n=1 Tax=Physcomitrium patens TaxID=3218 RepID=A0A2K1JZ05_PHYPA|nr:hypothetical protein PHYPA_013888 [Physcomitrium patens]
MASTSAVSSAMVVLAVIYSVAVMANAQATAPAPPPDNAASLLMPSFVASAMGVILTLFATRMLC